MNTTTMNLLAEPTDTERDEARVRILADAPWMRVEAFEGIEDLRVLAERVRAAMTETVVPLLLEVIDAHKDVERREAAILALLGGRFRESDEVTRMLAEAAGTTEAFDAVMALHDLVTLAESRVDALTTEAFVDDYQVDESREAEYQPLD